MTRPLRIEFPGALYHVISRGNERRPIVRDAHDREKRLYWLQRTVETYGWRLHAFVLLPNHEHLFLETPIGRLSAGLQFTLTRNGGALRRGKFSRRDAEALRMVMLSRRRRSLCAEWAVYKDFVGAA